MKRYMNTALLYAILAMVGGVFCREFTKFNGFTAKTTLSVVHTHYFLMGMVFFLLLLVLEKSFSCDAGHTGRDPGTGDHPLLRHERGHLRHGRNRSHPVGRQSGAAAYAAQAGCTGNRMTERGWYRNAVPAPFSFSTLRRNMTCLSVRSRFILRGNSRSRLSGRTGTGRHGTRRRQRDGPVWKGAVRTPPPPLYTSPW